VHQYSVKQAAVAVAAGVAKTVLQVATPATRRAKCLEIGVGFESVSATDGPALVELVRQTNAGTGTAATLVADDEGDPAALSSAKHTMTVEPTGPTVLRQWIVPVQSGEFVYQCPAGDEVKMAVSGFLGLRVTCPQNQTCDPYMKIQE